ncbi:hypothetical protein JW698_00925 [Candidatus Wolfebacteria bacterium]|nr:hypothetical protein [Candidatus Wolfebacteria bacterium]
MKQIKATIGVFIFVVALLIFFLNFKTFSPNKNLIPESLDNSKIDFNEEISLKQEFGSPFQWIEDSQKTSLSAINEFSKIKTENSPFQKIIEEIPSLTISELNLLSFNKTKLVEETKELENYWAQILEIWNKGFGEEKFELIKKNEQGRVLSLEELILEAENKGISEELKISFAAWQELGKKTLKDLENVSINDELSSAHQALISWFKYHSEIAGKFSKENLSSEEIKTLSSQYIEKAKTEPLKFQQALSLPEKSLTSFFIKIAQAQAENVFYHFGGLISSYADFCTNGFAIVVSAPKGGLLWIYYPAYIANPYLYKILAPSYYVLGRAMWGPGICNKGPYNYGIGAAQILFFGSSGTPL